MAPTPSVEGPSSQWRGPPKCKSQAFEEEGEGREAKHEPCLTGTIVSVPDSWRHPG